MSEILNEARKLARAHAEQFYVRIRLWLLHDLIAEIERLEHDNDALRQEHTSRAERLREVE